MVIHNCNTIQHNIPTKFITSTSTSTTTTTEKTTNLSSSCLLISPPRIISHTTNNNYNNSFLSLTFIKHSLYSKHYATVSPITISYQSVATLVPSNNASTKQAPQKNLIAFAAILFVISGALAAAETSITTLWPWKVRELAEKEGSKSPFATLEKDLTRFLTTILVSTTSATIFSTAIATDLASDFFGPSSVPYITVILTIIFLFLGEILPKSLAVHAPTKVARIMVPLISIISIIVYPVGKLLAWLSTHILRLLKLPMENDSTVSEEELRLIVAGADRSGAIEKYESQIIQNVLDLEDTDVSEVMCPRVDMVAIEIDNTLNDLIELEEECHYSRMPVYDSTVDNIVGVCMTKSLLRYVSNKNLTENLNEIKVLEIMDPAFFVPESMSVWVALEEMRKRRLHMAIVVDEYGGTAGLVTLEDILEEVVGEIYDEDDDYEADKNKMQIKKGNNGEMFIEGQTELEKVGNGLQLNLSEDDLHDYGTISGFLCAKMGGIPEVNDFLIFNKVKFTIQDTDDRRILKVKAETLTSKELAQMKQVKNINEEKIHENKINDKDNNTMNNEVESNGSFNNNSRVEKNEENERMNASENGNGSNWKWNSSSSSEEENNERIKNENEKKKNEEIVDR